MQKEGYVLLVGSLLVMKSSVLVAFLLSYKIQNKRLNRKIPNLEKLLLEKNLIRKKNKNDFGCFAKNLIRKTLVSVGYRGERNTKRSKAPHQTISLRPEGRRK